ncbi:putative pentatricopeptide repeat-containing protein At5g37570 [Lycium barbarum]|uniref:putative pentatricopeptide repeat-containing protein At5g37570 n=1 Tax=Lycium barbarum TaxID=112863 RepID=UPI00293F34BA|nr:putative pentatricopeptide repeat-containing protein At5g37570 [Lycium barbarum]
MICKNYIGFAFLYTDQLLKSLTNTANLVPIKLHHLQHYAHYSSSPFLPVSQIIVEVIHAKKIKDGSAQNSSISNYILNLCTKSNHLAYAQKLFDEIPQRDVRTWTILISGFAQLGCNGNALWLFIKMQKEGIVIPNEFTLSSVLKCCSSVSNGLRLGKSIHGWMITNAVDLDVALENAFLDLYVKCEALDYAKRFFELMVDKNVVSWNIMLAGYSGTEDMERSVKLFKRMPEKDVSSWNTIIDGLLQRGFERDALKLLREMTLDGPSFNEVTFSISLALMSSLRNLELGRQIHGKVRRLFIYEDTLVRASLIDMYCKCGQMEKASRIFQELRQGIGEVQHSHSVPWSTIISGYIHNGMLKDALEGFSSMVRDQLEVDVFTLSSILSVSANSGLPELGRQIHGYVQKLGHIWDIFLVSAIIDMYAKCGKLDSARLFFEQTQIRNIVVWTTMINSYGIHGKGADAVQLFEFMLNQRIAPNEVSFISVLTACGHAGLVKEGCKYFRLMKQVSGIKPGVEHFSCMVDLFGRAGCLEEAYDFIHENGISNMSEVWKVLLSSCLVHKNVKMARHVSEKLLQLQPSEHSPYILLSNTCSDNEDWNEASKLRGLMQERKVTKLPGQSWT